ncbi:MAG: lysophospholipase [Caloramator sp.]|nr:lysophospholipase [Caloramator sp.]
MWVFHGAKDEIVPIEKTKELVDVLIQCNGNVKFTIYQDARHDSWTETYKNKD